MNACVGAKPVVVEKKEEQGQGDLKEVNVNLDELLKSLSDAREKVHTSLLQVLLLYLM